jgi:hypothetical protein
MSAPEDPGPIPPSLVARPQGEGFYARLYPRPRPPLVLVLGTLGGFGAMGVLMALWFGQDTSLRLEIALSILLFGVLLASFAHFSSWFPIELVVDDTTVNWNGERIPMALVRDCTYQGGTVELRGEARTLGVIHHLQPEAARWVALAIRASIPTPPSG